MNNRGFTLVELTVVIAIIVLLSGIVLTNYRVGEKGYALLRSAQKLAQDLRTTEKMAMASEILPSNFDGVGGFPNGGYGIYFENNSNSYILFADCDNDKEYDAICPPLNCANNCAEATPSTPYPEKIKELSLEEKIKISNLYPSSPLSITFLPPDPVIKIKPEPFDNLAIITLTQNGQIKTVKTNTVGLIEID